MATTKLTLSLPEEILVEAKAYSRKSRQSLSELVRRYFIILARQLKPQRGGHLVSSKVQQLTGIAKSNQRDKDLLFDALKTKYLR